MEDSTNEIVTRLRGREREDGGNGLLDKAATRLAEQAAEIKRLQAIVCELHGCADDELAFEEWYKSAFTAAVRGEVERGKDGGRLFFKSDIRWAYFHTRRSAVHS